MSIAERAVTVVGLAILAILAVTILSASLDADRVFQPPKAPPSSIGTAVVCARDYTGTTRCEEP